MSQTCFKKTNVSVHSQRGTGVFYHLLCPELLFAWIQIFLNVILMILVFKGGGGSASHSRYVNECKLYLHTRGVLGRNHKLTTNVTRPEIAMS